MYLGLDFTWVLGLELRSSCFCSKLTYLLSDRSPRYLSFKWQSIPFLFQTDKAVGENSVMKAVGYNLEHGDGTDSLTLLITRH